MNGWKRITKEIKHKVLVTNNPRALNAHGDMSHVWMSDYVHQATDGVEEAKQGKFYDLDGPMFLTHYREIPQYLPASYKRAQIKRTAKLRKGQSLT